MTLTTKQLNTAILLLGLVEVSGEEYPTVLRNKLYHFEVDGVVRYFKKR